MNRDQLFWRGRTAEKFREWMNTEAPSIDAAKLILSATCTKVVQLQRIPIGAEAAISQECLTKM